MPTRATNSPLLPPGSSTRSPTEHSEKQEQVKDTTETKGLRLPAEQGTRKLQERDVDPVKHECLPYTEEVKKPDEKALASSFSDTYNGLYHVGAYLPKDIPDALAVFEKQKLSLDGALSQHRNGPEIQETWKKVCDSAQEYLTWSGTCDQKPVPPKLVQNWKKLGKLRTKAWDYTRKAMEQGPKKKIQLAKKANDIMPEITALRDGKVKTLQNEYYEYLETLRGKTPESVSFHKNLATMIQLVSEDFPDSYSETAIDRAVECWVENIMFNKGVLAAGLNLSDVE
ncbi:hypothetical protein M3P05_16310 [Sansalvadorimonas sp. 2012CJ34-2]|uniref:Uncharacterized protein n=1 Tax=Parendozoicomonas callyspongiae TaxID=2942213 RepID=A0ABT0PJD8_9GAMM|nr:hypothetical protein [Sansalvadorimonas sp. 2012CJ34-2]MCL6271485.1 hypothetical protein [Sansalvadorimonas sp. 2012CJ34-2]